MPKSYQDEIKAAVRHFWQTRAKQGERQGQATGQKDQGNRSLVTGGAQLDGFIELFTVIARDQGLANAEIHSRDAILPGFFRPTKEWDLLLIAENQLIASIEFKSHIGPSFGNNFNNRVEEALGTATDLLTAYREGIFGKQARPWLGYMMLLENHEKSMAPVANREPHFRTFPEFTNASYKSRYVEFCRRLLRERLYDGACLLASDSSCAKSGNFDEPDSEIDSATFISSLIGKITGFQHKRDLGR